MIVNLKTHTQYWKAGQFNKALFNMTYLLLRFLRMVLSSVNQILFNFFIVVLDKCAVKKMISISREIYNRYCVVGFMDMLIKIDNNQMASKRYENKAQLRSAKYRYTRNIKGVTRNENVTGNVSVGNFSSLLKVDTNRKDILMIAVSKFRNATMTLLCKCHTCRRRCSSEKDFYKLLFAPSPRPHNGHFAYCSDRLYIRWKRYKTNRARSEINLEKVIKIVFDHPSSLGVTLVLRRPVVNCQIVKSKNYLNDLAKTVQCSSCNINNITQVNYYIDELIPFKALSREFTAAVSLLRFNHIITVAFDTWYNMHYYTNTYILEIIEIYFKNALSFNLEGGFLCEKLYIQFSVQLKKIGWFPMVNFQKNREKQKKETVKREFSSKTSFRPNKLFYVIVSIKKFWMAKKLENLIQGSKSCSHCS
ncbi:hypothetical protein AGLY_009840 [Aphis glycines]|uniref:Uncharacterized protein n=1 Tax=Aphis glycines TaxID=307491 RepID=A0A6G0THL1_APHGL|nr:hypothetical protein AGLY_009840 [Aphis glycines]